MFTIRSIDPQGFENGQEITSWQYCPPIMKDGMRCPEILNLFFEDDKGPDFIERGTVYIMNRYGKTVARYELNSNVKVVED